MSALAAVRNEARARLWERGLSIENLTASEWIAAVDAEVEQLDAPRLVDEALASLDSERAGRIALQSLVGHLMSGSAWQFIHNTRSTGRYTLEHKREGCGLCDLLDEIGLRLWESRNLARSIVKAGAANSQESPT